MAEGNSINAQSSRVTAPPLYWPAEMHFWIRQPRHCEVAALAVSSLPAVLHELAVRQRHAGSVGHEDQGLLVAVAVAVPGIVIEPVRISAAAGQDRAGEFAS